MTRDSDPDRDADGDPDRDADGDHDGGAGGDHDGEVGTDDDGDQNPAPGSDPGGSGTEETRDAADGGPGADVAHGDGTDAGTGQGGGARRESGDDGPEPVGESEVPGIGGLFREERYVGLGVAVVVVLLTLGVLAGRIDPAYMFFLLSLGGVYVLLSMGLNVQWGYTGLINFSVAAFFGIGAYGVALATHSVPREQVAIGGTLPPTAGLVLGLLAALVLALLIGLPTLSLREDYLAIATLGLAEVVRLVLLTENRLTNGSAGLYGIPRLYANWPVLGDLTGRVAQAAANFGVVLAAVVLVWLGLRRVHRSPWGRTQRLIRTDEDLAEALGKNTYRFRLQSFIIGSLIMALAGALYTTAFVFVDPGLLSPIQTFYVWIAVIIGGTGSDRGAILGGAFVVAINQGTRELSDLAGTVAAGPLRLTVDAGSLRLFAIGVLIVLVIHFRPQGLLPPRRELIWTGGDGGSGDGGGSGE